ncbi:hypothetical protein CFC21_022831 [Triticum aestivum]|uniref:Uncharacterized protein n=2 Tax=Triticum aestivum TaxID=4565 RepID=A0A9R1ED85_WHEAT|nr:hypothetical protein CFC21_022830 [Triticum aestivum]KAF7007951.1 hypothetical protein CFC21_022831 [Triticum aestivum]
MSTVLKKISSATSGLNEAFTSLLRGFEVSKGPAANQSVEVAELRRQIGSIDADITLVNERLKESQDGAAAVEALRAELVQAKEQARVSNAAALKAAKELRAEQAAHRRSEEKVAKMAMELKNAADRYDLLEKKNKASSADLNKALNATKEMRTEVRGVREELQQASKITAGGSYLLRTKFLDPKYAPLDGRWSPADAYADLAKSTADAAKFFKDQGDKEVEKLFWSQFNAPARPLPLSEKMVVVAELHRLFGLAMRSVIDHLWPKRPKPDSYFGLVQQFLGVVPQIDAMRRSTCIEGARMALARVKSYWTDMEATIVATQNPAGGQYPAEHYLDQVTEGARLIGAQCSKNILFE